MSLSMSGWPDRRAPDVAAAGDGGEDAVGEHLVEHLDQGQHAQRRVLRRLDHDGVAHAQRRGDLPDRDHHRPVPRADRADHADGPVVQLGVGLAVVDDGLAGQRGGRGGAEPGRAGADLEAGVRAVERLALLPGEQLGERLGGRLDRVGGARSSRSTRSASARAAHAGCAARTRAIARSRSSAERSATRPTTSPVAGSRISRPSASVTAESRLSYVGVSAVLLTGSVTLGVVIVGPSVRWGMGCGQCGRRSSRRLDSARDLAEGETGAVRCRVRWR